MTRQTNRDADTPSAHPPMQFISYDAAIRDVTWAGAVEALRKGHGLSRPQAQDLLIGPEGASLLNRAAYIAGLGYAVKAETCMAANPARGLPSIQGAVILYDGASGSVRAVIESRLVTEFKTAADSVLAASLLARADSRHLVIAGAGVVAASLARAYSALFPRLERISIWARRPEQAAALAASLGDVRAELSVAADLRGAAEQADIIATATPAKDPILFGDWISPGTHVDLIGGYTPQMREADDRLMARAEVFVDYRETTVECVGDITQPVASGVMTAADVRGDLYDLIAADRPLRESASAITVFKNGGGAHLDLMIASYIDETVRRRAL